MNNTIRIMTKGLRSKHGVIDEALIVLLLMLLVAILIRPQYYKTVFSEAKYINNSTELETYIINNDIGKKIELSTVQYTREDYQIGNIKYKVYAFIFDDSTGLVLLRDDAKNYYEKLDIYIKGISKESILNDLSEISLYNYSESFYLEDDTIIIENAKITAFVFIPLEIIGWVIVFFLRFMRKKNQTIKEKITKTDILFEDDSLTITKKNLYITGNYLKTKTTCYNIDDLYWIYQDRLSKPSAQIPFYNMIFCFKNKKKKEIFISVDKYDELVTLIKKKYPKVIIGYSKDAKQKFTNL